MKNKRGEEGLNPQNNYDLLFSTIIHNIDVITGIPEPGRPTIN